MSSYDETGAGDPIEGLLRRVSSGSDLAVHEAEEIFTAVMEGRLSEERMEALLLGLATKGEAPSEIAGGVRALRRAMIPVDSGGGEPVVDTCGTGGGTFTTFNISTAAALVAAAGGVRIAKHGNRSFTSKCGSADLLEELGVAIQLSPDAMARVLEAAGIVFMFAPLLHPAMRHVARVRRRLGVTTIMNLLGPLTNPAGARRQVVGVPEPARLQLVARALQELGHERALVVHGEPGLDELSPVGATRVIELRDGSLREYRVAPARDYGWVGLDPGELAGGDPAHNAGVVREVLAGGGAVAARAAVVLNAAAALYIGGRVMSLRDGVDLAEALLDEGAAMRKLEELRVASALGAESAV